MSDRQHQILVRQRFADIAAGRITDDKTVLDVCPGGGKSRNVRIAVDELDKAQLAGGVIWLVPRASLAAQSRRGFNRPGDPFMLQPVTNQLRRSWGYVATYQKFISMRADIYAKGVADRMKGRPGIVMLVLDELHHCSDNQQQAWTAGVKKLKNALEAHGVRLHVMNMTGTLFRGDGQAILHVDYKEGKAVTHIRYGIVEGRGEGAVVPPEMVYVDGPVVIRSASGNEKAYQSMTEVPLTHRMKVRKAFLTGQVPKAAVLPGTKDSRQYTALYLLKYGMDHYLQKRKEWNHPLQTIVVASSAATALGYTSWLRQNYPELRIGCSLSSEDASKWAHAGFKHVKFPYPVIVTHDGQEYDISETITINEASETSSTFIEDFQLIVNGMPSSNYRQHVNALRHQMSALEEDEFNMLPIGEKIIRGFQADPINGENVIDVLVTVGKAYEGLDAPRCKHLICLTKQRSAPWLAQCFARAWRRDYSLQATGVVDQRCWIFCPRDAEMVDAVDRIVWDQDLAPIAPQRVELDDAEEMVADDVLTEEQRQTYEEFKRELEAEVSFIEAEQQSVDDDNDEIVFGDDVPFDNDEIEDDECELPEPVKPKEVVRAFSVIDRIIHEFVDDQARQMQVLKDERIKQEAMVQ